MYGYLWRRLPGPLAVRLLTVLVLALGIVALLFTVIYPALSPHLPFSHVTVDKSGGSA